MKTNLNKLLGYQIPAQLLSMFIKILKRCSRIQKKKHNQKVYIIHFNWKKIVDRFPTPINKTFIEKTQSTNQSKLPAIESPLTPINLFAIQIHSSIKKSSSNSTHFRKYFMLRTRSMPPMHFAQRNQWNHWIQNHTLCISVWLGCKVANLIPKYDKSLQRNPDT